MDPEKAGLKAKKILDYFRSNGLDVIHVQHISSRPGSTFFLPDTDGCVIHDYVKPVSNEKIIIKHTPNSFYQTELHDYLRSRNITDLVFCGMMTHMCVDSTVRAAKDLGFTCTLIGDACATKDLEISGHLVKAHEVHNGFLAALNYYYSKVMTTEEYIKVHSN